jgi:hypothetical protein
MVFVLLTACRRLPAPFSGETACRRITGRLWFALRCFTGRGAAWGALCFACSALHFRPVGIMGIQFEVYHIRARLAIEFRIFSVGNRKVFCVVAPGFGMKNREYSALESGPEFSTFLPYTPCKTRAQIFNTWKTRWKK